jgi:hypothetical protein
MSTLRRLHLFAALALVLLVGVLPATAAETMLQNDSFVAGQSAGFQGGFTAGEMGAVRLVPTGPFPLNVTRVQLLFGGATTTQVVTLHIWDDSAGAAAPGIELYANDYTLTGADTALQEIDLTGAGVQVSGAFRVGIEFQHSGTPSIARDNDGIAAGRNFVNAVGLGWLDSAALGLTGDWIIRAGVTAPSGGGGGVVQNDSFLPGQSAGFQGGFVAGEMGAARLLPSGAFPQQVSAVRFLFGGAAGTRTVTLHVWDDPTGAATPGTELYTGDFQVTAADNALQELDLSAAGISVSGPFRVGIEFQHSGTPSIARDNDGITPGRNFISMMGSGWIDAAALGVTGDWIIRAVMGPAGPGPGAPEIISVADIARDQGRSVRVRFARSNQDAAGAATPVTAYEIYRRVDPLKGARPAGDAGRTSALLDGWDYVGSAPAHGESAYSLVVPTLADSTIAAGQHWSVFLVRAATASPYVFFDSPADSGWSVDNLAPGAPAGLALAAGVLTWAPSPAADFDYFSVYRSTSPVFDGTAVLATHTTATTAVTGGAAAPYWYVTVTDFAGNRGPAAQVMAASAVDGTARPAPAPLTAWPNPFNPRVTIAWDLPAAVDGTLEVFAMDGTRVRTLLSGTVAAGPGEVQWDGRDQNGRDVATGAYVARLRTADRVQTQRLLLVR